MSRHVQEGDRLAVSFGELEANGQILRDRVFERDFAASHHVRQHECGEHLCHRADLEDCVAIERTRVLFTEPAVRNDPSASGSDYADDDADALALGIDAFNEYLANITVRWQNEYIRAVGRLGAKKCGHQADNDYRATHDPRAYLHHRRTPPIFQPTKVRLDQIPVRSPRRQRQNSRLELVEKRAGLHEHGKVPASLYRDECLRRRPDGVDERARETRGGGEVFGAYAKVSALLGLTAICAGYLPARRITRIDAASALRAE